jgi:hypothetical protein
MVLRFVLEVLEVACVILVRLHLLLFYLLCSFALKMEAVRFFETAVSFYQITRRYVPEERPKHIISVSPRKESFSS